jgi:hypothetical protein
LDRKQIEKNKGYGIMNKKNHRVEKRKDKAERERFYWQMPNRVMNGMALKEGMVVVDFGELTRANKLFNKVKGTPDQLAARLANPKCVEIPIVAEIENQVVGFAALRAVPTVFYEKPHAELTEIY